MKFGNRNWIGCALLRSVAHFLSERLKRDALMTGGVILRVACITDYVIALRAESSWPGSLPVPDDNRFAVRACVAVFFEDSATRTRRQPLCDYDLIGYTGVDAVVDRVDACEAGERSHVKACPKSVSAAAAALNVANVTPPLVDPDSVQLGLNVPVEDFTAVAMAHV